MELSNKQDAALGIAISVLAPLIVLVSGDPLYVGLWYYLVIPAFVVGWGVLLDAPPPYVAGASLAVAVSLFAYMSYNWFAARPEGLLGLGHLMSLPGGVIGYFAAMRLARRSSRAQIILALGCLGWGVGFLINHFLLPVLMM
jgi:hypothetical protein